jgi:hypothetical protein
MNWPPLQRTNWSPPLEKKKGGGNGREWAAQGKIQKKTLDEK